MKAPLIAAFLFSVSQVLGSHSYSDAQTRKELCEMMGKPYLFLPGTVASKVLKKLKRTVHRQLLLMDIADSFHEKDEILIESYSDYTCIVEDIGDFNDVKVATLVFRIDGLLEYLAIKPEMHQRAFGKLLASRGLIVAFIREYFPYRRLLLELIANSPSFFIRHLLDGRTIDITPMSYLHQADLLVTSKYADPFEVINLKSAIVGLLPYCLSNPSVAEHERQLWMTEFADSCFWMSSTRVAMCIAAMLREKRYEELALLQYNFTLEQWKIVSKVLAPCYIKCAPETLQNLIGGNNCEPYRQVLSDLLIELQEQSYKSVSMFLKIILSSDIEIDKVLLTRTVFRTIESYETVDDIAKDSSSIISFSIVYGLLILMPDLESKFEVKHPTLLKLGACNGPLKEIYSSYLFPLSESSHQLTIKGKKHQVTTKALISITIGLIRNLHQILFAEMEMALRPRMVSLLQPGDKASFIDKTVMHTELFLRLCEQICKYKFGKHDLMGDLKWINFADILNSDRLSLPMKTILLEGVVGMYICRGLPYPEFLKKIAFGGTSLSLVVGRVRDVNKSIDLSQYVGIMKIMRTYLQKQPGRYMAAYAMFVWAMLPRIMDDDSGADDVSEALDMEIPSNNQYSYICETAFTMMQEFTSIKHLRRIMPQSLLSTQASQSIKLSICKRSNGLSLGVCDKEGSNHYLKVLVKRFVPNNSIEYSNDYFTGQVKLDPVLMSYAIVEAIQRIGQGAMDNIQLFPKSILNSIFLEYTSSHCGFFDRVRFELELHLHLPLMSKEVKMKTIELLCVLDEFEEKQKKFLEDLDKFCKIEYAVSEMVATMEQEPTVAVPPSPNILKPPQSRQTSVSKSRAESGEKKNHASASPVVDPARPSRTRLRPISQSAKNNKASNEPKTIDQKKPQKQLPKPQETNAQPAESLRQKVESGSNQQKTKEKYHRRANNDNTLPVKEEIAQAGQAQINNEQKKQSPFEYTNCTSDDTAVMKTIPKVFKLTIKSLRENATFQADGQVVPNDGCTEEFKEYIKEEVKNGSLPFKLHPQLLLFLTQRKYREQFKNTTWKAVKNWTERKVWRPKVHTPVRVFVKGATMDEISRLKGFVFQLTNEKIARLQSLCYFSNLAVTISGKALEHLISRRTLKFEISTKAQTYQVHQGWIQMPCFPKAFQEFSDAIAPLLSELPVTSNSVSTVYSNAAKKTTKARVVSVKPRTVLSKEEKALGKEKSEEEIELRERISESSEMGKVLQSHCQAVVPIAASKEKLDSHLKDSLTCKTTSHQQFNSTALHLQNTSTSTNLKEEKIVSSSPVTGVILKKLKADSPEFVPKENDETSGQLSILKNTTKKRFNVTRSNCKQMLADFDQLLSKGLEYVALDCEMTGLYTRAHEAEHSRDQSLRKVGNTMKLIAAMDENTMFQLGLTVKTRNGEFYIWNFFTDPTLSTESFTPETFNFLFLKQLEGRKPSEAELFEIENKIQGIARDSVSVAPFLSRLFRLRVPLILFSGYVDLMHLLKACGRHFKLTHEQIQEQMKVDFYDIKLIAKLILKRSSSLESLLKELYDGLNLDMENMHDASYDSFLTALAYDKLKEVFGKDCMLKQVLFNYETQ